MAKPIKETPILYNEDAYKFEMKIRKVKPLSKKRQEEIRKTYEKFKKIADFSL